MSREARLISNSLILFLLAGVVSVLGCTTASDRLKPLEKGASVERVFFASYEEVERALKQAMIKYPQRVDNTEAGIFETDYIKGEQRFKPANLKVHYSNGYIYRILLRLVRGRTDDKNAVKVVVTKQIELKRDFFADSETIASDGLEELVILYRIQREIAIDRAVRKSQEKTNQKMEAAPG